MVTTKLNLEDILPLTCSRTGTCCHGKQVLLNPWELYSLAKEKKISPMEFRDLYCEFGGIRLKFNGKPGWKDLQACSQYDDHVGCTVHLRRPLSCRLYPLGRQIQSEVVHYVFEGNEFPCLEGCPVVTELPQLSVGNYLEGQFTDLYEKAQDAYLDFMQNVADLAFVLLLETGLAESGDKKTLSLWRKMGNELPEDLATRIGSEWINFLMLPEIEAEEPIYFIQKHLDLINSEVQEQFGALQSNSEWHKASVLMMGIALHLARGLGANPQDMADLWIETAKKHGAQE